MTIDKVEYSNKRKDFLVKVGGRALHFPFHKASPAPTMANPILRIFVDPELGSEAFTYMLKDGSEGTIHVDHVLEYNEDPEYMMELFVYKLTTEVKNLLKQGRTSKREIARRLHTSPAQLYRLLDEGRTSKSLPQMFTILRTLDCGVDLVIKKGRYREVIEL